MYKPQEEIKAKSKKLNIGNVINWFSINRKKPPKDTFLLVKRKGYLPYCAILENGVWDDRTERGIELIITHWTEMP